MGSIAEPHQTALELDPEMEAKAATLLFEIADYRRRLQRLEGLHSSTDAHFLLSAYERQIERRLRLLRRLGVSAPGTTAP